MLTAQGSGIAEEGGLLANVLDEAAEEIPASTSGPARPPRSSDGTVFVRRQRVRGSRASDSVPCQNQIHDESFWTRVHLFRATA